MLKPIQYICVLIAGSIGFCSCEKVIDVKLNNADNQLVIEGGITDQLEQQVIKISKSVLYTENNTYPAVTGATVVVTDDQGASWTLAEAAPGTYTFGPVKGAAGRRYSMKATVGGTVYTASSTMPAAVAIDSLDVKVFNFGGESRQQAQVHYKDPANIANQYRFILKVNGLQSKRVYADNDRLTDGRNVPNVLFYNGKNDDDDELKAGDKVEVEMQCIDKDIFTYWYTLSQQTQNGPGGGVTPSNPPSNIIGGTLGYFSAHTVSKMQMVVK